MYENSRHLHDTKKENQNKNKSEQCQKGWNAVVGVSMRNPKLSIV